MQVYLEWLLEPLEIRLHTLLVTCCCIGLKKADAFDTAPLFDLSKNEQD